ncbi:MAG TPA: DNA-3-methyladenine glycosylase 2 family protein [Burkholderiales bacterium]|jgi:DNA-3-methyladenine glycosylase II|nr:DNA-3-methyladenine glycosylase 2 family protein [Burkholderiales bacterium]
MRTPEYWEQATRDLAERDAVLRGLIERYRGLALASRGDAFTTLARSIVGQQISVKAAQSVWDRLAAQVGEVSPAAVRRVRMPTLRRSGLSGQKAAYLKDLASQFLDGTLDAARWHALDDETLIAELTRVKGIGRWTAEMFLMFHLVRPDVLPLADLGLQRAMRLHYNRGRVLSDARMRRIGAVWAPWRSVATWYLWRSLDPIPVEY